MSSRAPILSVEVCIRMGRPSSFVSQLDANDAAKAMRTCMRSPLEPTGTCAGALSGLGAPAATGPARRGSSGRSVQPELVCDGLARLDRGHCRHEARTSHDRRHDELCIARGGL